MAHEVRTFLRNAGFECYFDVLLKHGWDRMGILALMQDRDMKQMGIKMGHRRQLQMILSSCMTWQCYPFPLVPFWNTSASEAPFTALTSMPEKSIDTQILLIIIVVRLVADVENVLPGFLPQAVPFSRDGKVCQACAGALKDATAVRVALEQKKKLLLMEKKRKEVEQLVNSTSVQAYEYTCQAVQSLRAMRDADESLPLEHESQMAAAVITNHLYQLAMASTRTLDKSYAHFQTYLDSVMSDSIVNTSSLGPAMAELKRNMQQEPAALKTLIGHALRTIVMLISVYRAGGHTDRNQFDWHAKQMLRSPILDEAERQDLRSSIHHCFKKSLGDLVDAFQCKSRGKLRCKSVSSKHEQEHEPEPEVDEGGVKSMTRLEQVTELAVDSALDTEQSAAVAWVVAEQPAAVVETESILAATAAKTAELTKQPAPAAQTVVETESILVAPIAEAAEVTEQPTPALVEIERADAEVDVCGGVEGNGSMGLPGLVVKKTFLEVEEHAPEGKQKYCPSEPPRKCGLTSSCGDGGDLQTLVEEPCSEGQRYCVISELNFTLLWRDYKQKFSWAGALEYNYGRTKVHIRPGAASFVSKLLAEERCTLVFISCSGWHHCHNMALLLLQQAVAGTWEVKGSKNGRLPYLVGPSGQQVYLVYGEMGSEVPKDFLDKGSKGFVKDLERVFEALRASRCEAFNINNTVVLDSTKGHNAQTGSVLELPMWTAGNVTEDGSMFQEVWDYLFHLFESGSSVPQYLDDIPCKGCKQKELADDEDAERKRRQWEMDVSSMPVRNSDVWGQYGDRWFMCTVLEVKGASTILVKWHYDGSEAELPFEQVRAWRGV